MPAIEEKLSHQETAAATVQQQAGRATGVTGRSNSGVRVIKGARWAWGLVIVTAAPVLGFLALNTSPIAVLLLASMPLLWAASPNRWVAGLTAGAFVAAAGWSVAPAVPNHFEDASLLMGVGAVAIVGGIHALIWFLAWASGIGRAFSGVAAIMIFALPPMMWVGWASPLNAAGVVLPGLGWFGLGLFLGALMFVMMSRILSLLAVVALSGAVFVLGPEMPLADRVDPRAHDWTGIDTHLGQLEITNARAVTERQRDVFRAIEESRGAASRVLLPETITGEWAFAEPMWSTWESPGFGALLGTQVHRETRGYHNSLVGVGQLEGIRYDQRVPIPWAMWNPLDPDSARASITGPGTVMQEDQVIGALVCYEQLVVFPILTTLWEQPDVIVAPANAWWAANEAIPEMQKNIMQSWSRLFRTPVLTAINYPEKPLSQVTVSDKEVVRD